jgi:hypothetical protein
MDVWQLLCHQCRINPAVLLVIVWCMLSCSCDTTCDANDASGVLDLLSTRAQMHLSLQQPEAVTTCITAHGRSRPLLADASRHRAPNARQARADVAYDAPTFVYSVYNQRQASQASLSLAPWLALAPEEYRDNRTCTKVPPSKAGNTSREKCLDQGCDPRA